MQRESSSINFTTQAEVRSQAESRRTEEISGLIRALFDGWTTRLRGHKPVILSTVQYAWIDAGARNRPTRQD